MCSSDLQYGMRTRQQPRRQQGAQPQQQQGGIGDRLLGAVLNEALRPPPGQQGASVPTDRGEAYVRAPITDSFSVTLSVSSRSRDGGRVEWVVYQGRDRTDGYRLAYTPDSAPNFELVRVTNGRGTTIGDSGRNRLDIEDGRDHRIVWTRDRDGNFQVEIDGKSALDARDRPGSGGFGIVNLGGDYGLRQVTIAGTDQRR